MPTQGCLNNVKKKDPPTYCGEHICGAIQQDINAYCRHVGIGDDVPVPQFPDGKKCWCCCSCVAWGTPVEVEFGLYRAIETITKGMTVLTTGNGAAEWEASEVSGVGGIAPGQPLDYCYTAYFTMSDGASRVLTSTADHLYLVPDNKVRPIQALRPGDRVVAADATLATVSAVVIGQFSGGVRNFALGEWEPEKHPDDPFKGHLVNTFGLVTGDLALQLSFLAQPFGADMLAGADEETIHIGSPEFFETYDTTAYDLIMRSPEMWPPGFAVQAKPLINVPASALGYFSAEQANDLLESNQDLGESDVVASFKYLRRLFSGFFP